MIKKIAILTVVLIVAVLGYAATQPDTFRIQRSAHIKAAPEAIFLHIDILANWPAWSPWAKLDPAMKTTLSGPSSGKGAVASWDGNNEVGTGRMEIMESIPPSKITFKLDFIKPFEAHNISEFTLERVGEASHVTWAMSGPRPYLAKVMGLFVDCDKMVGRQFEEGLANIKSLAETVSQQPPA